MHSGYPVHEQSWTRILHIHKENFSCATMTHPPGLVNGDQEQEAIESLQA
jgi:hypothetical protein